MHAVLCGNSGCSTGNANTTYIFADANNGMHGGSRLTTDGSGNGPNDSENWAAASYFGGAYQYWANIGNNSGTVWNSTGAWAGRYSCNGGWLSGTNSYNGDVGQSNAADASRWVNAANPGCNTTEHLICRVDP